ncbi:DUF1983 domain-containing protein [Shewanella avicenniae]|uniref:DUF1983 domain-containing protein n=1 Tax=Shewanella avicenniae TaxID=2814294 RepID=A0ABX7QMZ3_9GAMM|nr:DUF1983 domain-containing protein [Shewanella avicenniae]QSX32629.1 DUF1983 domain-containing protein [Shewanella avicenniae]
MSDIIEGTLKGVPVGKLLFNRLGIDAWWEVDAGKWVRDALMPSVPDFSNDALNQQQMVKNPIEARRTIYGRAMVSGPMVYAEESGDDNEYLHIVIPLAAHKCDAIEEIWFDDVLVWDGALNSDYRDHARIKIHLGDQTNADSELVAEASNWTTEHVGVGITYIYVRLLNDGEFWTSGVPNVKALVRGKPVYDPRKDSTIGGSGNHIVSDDSTWEWSDNWALCVLDFTLFEAGIGAAVSEVNMTSFANAANDSDQRVIYNESGDSERRYTCNGTCTQAQSPTSILEKMLTAGAGMMAYIGGEYTLTSGVYQGPYVIELTEDDLAGNIELRPFNARANLFNTVKGTFVDPDSAYQATDFPPYESDYYRNQDNGEYITSDVDYPFTQSVYTAQRLAKLALEMNRAGQQISVPVNMIGLAINVGMVIKLNLPRLGINAEYQVLDREVKLGDPVYLTLRITSAELYDYAMGSYTIKPLTPPLNLPDPSVVPSPKNLTWTSFDSDASQLGQLTWEAPGGVSSYRYRIEIQSGDFLAYQMNITGTVLTVPRIDAGNYTVKVWAINMFSNRSNNPAELLLAVATAPPLIGIDVDASLFELRITPRTAVSTATSTVFNVKGGETENVADATDIGTGKTVVWTGLRSGWSYYLWAQTVNDYGISEWFGPVAVSTSSDNTRLTDSLADSITESMLGQALLSKIDLATQSGSALADNLAAVRQSIDDAKQQLLLAQFDISTNQQDRVAFNARIALLDEARELIDSRLGELGDQVGTIGTRISNVETENAGTAARLSAVEASSEQSASRVASLEQASDEQALSIDDLETVNASQSSRLTNVEQTNASQAQSLTQLQTQQNSQGTSIANLQQTTADQALEIQQIEAEQGNQSSRINNLQQASSDQAQQFSELETELNDQSSRVSQVEATTATQAQSLTQLQTQQNNQGTSIANLQQTTADQALEMQQIEAEQGQHSSSINTLQQASSDYAQQISELETESNDQDVRITELTKTSIDSAERAAQLQVEKDNAAAEMLLQEFASAKEVRRTAALSVRAGEAESNITELQQVTATTAKSVQQLSSKTDDNEAAIEISAQTLADLNGQLSAMLGIKVQVNNRGELVVAGIGVGVENTPAGLQSQILFLADRIAFLNSINGDATPLFVMQDGVAVLNAAIVGDLTIDFAKLKGTLRSADYVPGENGFMWSKNGGYEIVSPLPGGGKSRQTPGLIELFYPNGNRSLRLGGWT